MKKFLFIFPSFLSLVFLTAPDASAQWEPTNGPFGGNVQCFASMGMNIFAGTYGGGVFRSTDDGTNWAEARNGLTDSTDGSINIQALAVIGQNLFAVTQSGIAFRSTDSGMSWKAENFGAPYTDVKELAVAGSKLYANIGGYNPIYVSSDSGMRWVPDTAMPNFRELIAIGTNLFALIGNSLYISSDSGINWHSQSTNMPGDIMAVKDTDLYAGGFLSTNNGISWAADTVGMGSKQQITAIAVSGSNLFAGTYMNGVFLSTNNGKSWSAASNGLPLHFGQVQGFLVSGMTLFVSDYDYIGGDGGIFQWIPNDSSWVAANVGLTAASVLSFAGTETNLFVGTYGDGIDRSTNNGTSWTTVNNGLSDPDAYALAVYGTNLFDGSDSIFLSRDSGANWMAASIGLKSQFQCFAIMGSELFAGANGNGVFRSTNNGTSWISASDGLTATNVTALAVIGNNLFAGTYGGVFLSRAGGTGWVSASSGLTNTDVTSLAVIGTNLFAGTNSGGVFLSTDSGLTWMATDLTQRIVYALAVSGTTLFAGTYPGGVYLSTNNGVSWTLENDGLTNTNVTALIATGSNLFAGFDGNSVWRRPLSDFGISSVAPPLLADNSLTAYPNPFSNATTLRFTAEESGYATVTLVNPLGVEVSRVFAGELGAGEHSLPVTVPAGLAAGMYECIIHCGGRTKNIPIVVEQ